jgi:hypothetical protein
MSEEFSDAHAHMRRVSEIDRNALRIEFSPEMIRAFARLEAAVHKSQHFSPEILANLQESAQGKSVSIDGAFTRIATVVREAMEHFHATGDERTKEAVDDFISQLMEEGPGQPFTLCKMATRGR